jgi:putative DNA primase/helicase
MGWTADLLPILPPTATLSPHTNVDKGDRGKVPGLYNKTANDWRGFKGWTKKTTSDEQIAKWGTWPGVGVGLRAARTPGVDIDSNYEALVTAIEHACRHELGPAPVRGREGSARRLLVYRLANGCAAITKQRIAWTMPGSDEVHAVELLGDGQQYVIEGVHPSGKPYVWRSGGALHTHRHEDLTPITPGDWHTLVGIIKALVVEYGGTLVGESRTSHTGAAHVKVGEGAIDEKHFARLAEALHAIPCEELDYHDWIKTLAAAKGACGGDEDFYHDHVLPWSLKYSDNTDEVIREKWDSIHETMATAANLFATAKQHGWKGNSAIEFEPLDDVDEPEEPVKPKQHYDERTLARRFATEHGHEIAFTPRWGWLVWTGSLWQYAEEGLAAEKLMGEFLERVRDEARASNRPSVELGKASKVTAVLKHVKPLVSLPISAWDADPWLLNCPDATYDLRTGKAMPHDPANRCTKMTAVAPNREQPLRWQEFLYEMTLKRGELSEFLQRFAGYGATGFTIEEALIFLIGIGGSGKSTFINTVGAALGSYAAWATMEAFSDEQGTRHTTDLAMLHDKRLVIIDEVKKGGRWNEQRIKAVTGGASITARFLHKDNFTFKPKFKVAIAANDKPHLQSVGPEITRRFCLVPCDFVPQKADRDLKELLLAELPHILWWIIQGAINWAMLGLEPPALVQAETARYVKEEDTIGQWLAERVVIHGGNALTEVMALYDDFREWCGRNGEKYVPSMKLFSPELEKRGMVKTLSPDPKNRRACMRGVELRAENGFTAISGGVSEGIEKG